MIFAADLSINNSVRPKEEKKRREEEKRTKEERDTRDQTDVFHYVATVAMVRWFIFLSSFSSTPSK